MLNLPKQRNKINRQTIIIAFVLVLFVLYFYFPLTKTFYQQDEWLGYGNYLANGTGFIFSNTSGIFTLIFAQGRIFSNLIFYLFVRFSPLNISPFAIFAIIFHSLNVILIFFLSKKIFKKDLPAFLGSLFFAINSVSQSAVTWPAASVGTLPSTTLIIFGVYAFFKFLEKKSSRWLVITFVSLYFSLFFKESGIFLFFFLPLISLIFEKFSFRKFISTYWVFLTFFVLDTVFRIFEIKTMTQGQALFLTDSSASYWQTLLTRGILYPITSFSLTFVPPEPFVWFARSVANIYYPFIMREEFILISQTIVVDLLSLCLSFTLFILIYFLLKISDKNEGKKVIFFVGFILFSFLPYILIGKSYAYLESRYFYLASFAGAVILAWIIKIIFERFNIFIKIIILILSMLFISVHLKYLRNDISSDVLISQERKSFLSQFSQQLPPLLQKRNVIFITSDRDYYVIGNKIPFQQGAGYTIMVWLYNTGNIPSSLLSSGYLFDIGSQGYKEEGSRAFGYFTDGVLLKEAIKRYGLSKDNVMMFYYHSLDQKLERINEKNI